MTTCKRIFSVLLLLVLLAGIVPLAQAELTAEETYDEHLELLNLYMQGGGADDGISIDALVDAFMRLGTYKESMNFWLYASILQYVKNGNYDDAISYHTILTMNEDFCNMLKDDPAYSEQYSAICSVEELELYVQGRKAEHEGNKSLAVDYYSQCLGCMDARDRFLAARPNLNDVYGEALALIQKGNYAAAKEKAQYLLDNGFDAAKDLMVVIDARLAAEANAKAATPVPAKPTATPTPKPQWSAWSDWSATNPGSDTSTREVQQKNQYRYRTSSTTQQWSAWSGWSSWSETAVSETDSRDVETKQETKTTTTYKYRYTRWKYFNTSKNAWWESYCEYTGASYKPESGYWQSKTTDTPLDKTGTVDGRPVYEGYWYNETKEAVNTSTTVTMYRYRTRTKQNVTTWGGYTAWQDERVSSSSTCEVQTRTVYRYRELK